MQAFFDGLGWSGLDPAQACMYLQLTTCRSREPEYPALSLLLDLEWLHEGPLRCGGQVPCRHRLTALVAALAACGRGGRPRKAVVFVSSCDAADFVPRLLQV